MEIKNLRPWPVDIPNVGIVDAGGTIEVDNDLGKSLTEQPDNFEKVTPKKGAS
jgi:hypothetical protein